MGFSWLPPRPEVPLALQVIDTWAPRGDTALMQQSPPWASLLNGIDAATLVTANELGVADYYRQKGLTHLVVNIDPTNGLDRSADAPELLALGRSLTEPAVQLVYRAYAVAIATVVQPAQIGLASETNLVRAVAPPALYQALVQTAAAAAADVRAANATVGLFATVQVEVAWGRPGTTFVGIAVDRVDFPFATSLGLSSYPYLGGFHSPTEMPDDYFTRIADQAGLPVFALEGGWPSVDVGAVASDPLLQVDYVHRQARLLDAAAAIAWFQITFTDLEVASYSPGVAPFADLGLVTTNLAVKPALAAWDAEFGRPLR